ncbi:MAG: hypothetical protein KJP13_04765, partial [Altererythrobacter sp.]|nr:hypothetical protein [Altererythrobacter sp.]
KLKNAFDRRSFVVSTAMGGIGVLLAARMAYLSVGENEKYRTEAESRSMREGCPVASGASQPARETPLVAAAACWRSPGMLGPTTRE